MRKDLLGIALILGFISVTIKGQGQNLVKNNKYSATSSLFLSTTDKLPFWLRVNQYGEVPIESQFLQLSVDVHHEYDSIYNKNKQLNKFSFGYGARGIANVGKINQLIVSEAYAKIRFKNFELYAGRRKEIIGLVDSSLSSGSYIWSGNALPIPKLQISIPNYTPLGKGLISIKGSFAHGWFGSTDSVQNYYLHQKTFYARIGRPSWKVKFYTGLNHQVQWGGMPTVPWYDTRTDQIITQYPSDFKTYINVVSGLSLNRKLDAGLDKDGIPYNEAFNRAGNHLGTVDLALQVETTLGTLLLYKQSIYEDGSLFYLSNISDGLTGVSLNIKRSESKIQIQKINLEYLSTSNQGGANGSHNSISELRGRDNYFNNSLYKDGYTYKNQTIGTPFILPLSNYKQLLTEAEFKQLNSNFLLNNRIEAINFGIHATYMQNIRMLYKYSFSNNKGNYSYPLSEKQASFLAQLGYKSNNNIMYGISLSFDNGSFLEKNFGTRISIVKEFL